MGILGQRLLCFMDALNISRLLSQEVNTIHIPVFPLSEEGKMLFYCALIYISLVSSDIFNIFMYFFSVRVSSSSLTCLFILCTFVFSCVVVERLGSEPNSLH